MDQDKYAEALALYARAYSITNDPALLYNQGRALEAMGEYPDALEKLEQFERDATPALRAKVPGLRELITDLRGRISTLVVTTNAPGARLLVRDKALATLHEDATKVRVRSGLSTIEVVAEGFVPFKREVELVAGAVVKVDAQLVSKKSEPVVSVKTTPSADVAVDGKSYGRAPLDIHLSAGSHVLIASADGYEDQKIKMALAFGDRRDLAIELKKDPGILHKWWFWVGAGAIIAAGVTTVIVLTTERSPDNGTFGPGVVTGP